MVYNQASKNLVYMYAFQPKKLCIIQRGHTERNWHESEYLRNYQTNKSAHDYPMEMSDRQGVWNRTQIWWTM